MRKTNIHEDYSEAHQNLVLSPKRVENQEKSTQAELKPERVELQENVEKQAFFAHFEDYQNQKKSASSPSNRIMLNLDNFPEKRGNALREKKKIREKKKKWGFLLFVLVSVVLTLALILGIAWIYVFGQITHVSQVAAPHSSRIQQENEQDEWGITPAQDEIRNILLIGVDAREENELTSNADTMMLLTLNQKDHTLKLTSFQRDMLVKIPGQNNFHKINSSMFGGPEALLRTLNYNFKLNLKDFILVNFRGAEDVIDEMGGLDWEVPDDPDVLQYLNSIIWDTNKELQGRKYWANPIEQGGLQHLNGRQIICFARMRKLDSDFNRMERQQAVLRALFQKFKEMNVLKKVQIMRTGLGFLSTNLDNQDLLSLGVAAMKISDLKLETYTVPQEGLFKEAMIGGTSYIIPDLNNLQRPLHEFLYGSYQDDGKRIESYYDLDQRWSEGEQNPSNESQDRDGTEDLKQGRTDSENTGDIDQRLENTRVNSYPEKESNQTKRIQRKLPSSENQDRKPQLAEEKETQEIPSERFGKAGENSRKNTGENSEDGKKDSSIVDAGDFFGSP